MKGMTKAYCVAFEKRVFDLIVPVLGNPIVDNDRYEWSMPHETGVVKITLIRDSLQAGRERRSSWLACRLEDGKYVGADGYVTKDGFPYPFTKTNGKHNFHPASGLPIDNLVYQVMTHLELMCDEKYSGKFAAVNTKTLSTPTA